MRTLALAILFALSVCVGFAGSAVADKHEVFGQSLITAAEVSEYKTRLPNCKNDQERGQVQGAHKERMVQRAHWKGLVIRPDTLTIADND